MDQRKNMVTIEQSKIPAIQSASTETLDEKRWPRRGKDHRNDGQPGSRSIATHSISNRMFLNRKIPTRSQKHTVSICHVDVEFLHQSRRQKSTTKAEGRFRTG
jgi:hypothetical protein